MPVCAEQGGVDDSHVRAHLLHLLGIPEREGVVVSVGDEYSVFPTGIQIVAGHFDGCAAVTAVVVVPVFLSHKRRHAETEQGHSRCSHCRYCLGRLFLTRQSLANQVI